MDERPQARGYTVDGDGTVVWVHLDGECVARFGKVAYEVYDLDMPRNLVRFGRETGADEWRGFVDAVRDVHGRFLSDALAPVRLHGDLGVVNDSPLFAIPVSALAERHDPFARDVWGRGRVTREDVAEALAANDLEPCHVDMGMRMHLREGWDARRIAYLVRNPSRHPIEIEIDEDAEVAIRDGYHRLASAIYREAQAIEGTLGGFLGEWHPILDVARPLNRAAEEMLDDGFDAVVSP